MTQQPSLAQQLIEACIKTKNPILDLGNCGLTDDSPELEMMKECGHVEVLNLGKYNFSNGIKSECKNSGTNNVFGSIPKIINTLDNLTCFSADDVGLDSCLGINELQKLKYISLSKNKITEIKGLIGLKLVNVLDLSYNSLIFLTDLPGQYSESSLQKLFVNDNKIKMVGSLNGFKKLIELNVENNSLNTLLCFRNLSMRCVVSFKNNPFEEYQLFSGKPKLQVNLLNTILKRKYYQDTEALLRIKESILTENPILDLSRLGLSLNSSRELRELEKCNHLEKLNMGNGFFYNEESQTPYNPSNEKNLNNVFEVVPIFKGFKKLKHLYLSNIKLNDLKLSVDLKQLKVLDISNNKLKISETLRLQNLEILHLDNNDFESVEAFHNLSELKELWLDNNKLSSLVFITNFPKLETLYLDENQITDIDNAPGHSSLKKITLNSNKIFTVIKCPEWSSIDELRLDNNQIKKIRIDKKLSNLHLLSLRNNKLTDLSWTFVTSKIHKLYLDNNLLKNLRFTQKIQHLRELTISKNIVDDIDDISQLSELNMLDLSGNKFQTLSPLLKLKNLHTLYLTGMNFTDITPLLSIIREDFIINPQSGFLDVNGIHVDKGYNNPSPEVINAGYRTQKTYYIQFEQKKVVSKTVATAVIQGNSGSGKSTFMKFVEDGKIDKVIKSTELLNIIEINLDKNKKLKIIDFGGQDYFHGTYSLFQNESNIRIVMYAPHKNKYEVCRDRIFEDVLIEDFPLSYWLNSFFLNEKKIETDINDYENIDASKDGKYFFLIRNIHVNQERPNVLIEDCFKSCVFDNYELNTYVADTKLNFCVRRLKELAIEKLKDETTVEAFEDGRNILKNKYGNRNILVKQDIINEFPDETIASGTLDYLNECLDVLYFHENGLIINNIPWFVSELYRILFDKNSFVDKTKKILKSEFIKKLKIIDKTLHSSIYELLLSKGLFFESKDGKFVLIPQLLHDKENSEYEIFISGFEKPKVKLKFNFHLHRAKILEIFRVIHKEPNYEKTFFWKNGLVIKSNDEKGIVKLEIDQFNKEISFSVYNEKQVNTTLISQIIHKINEISFGKDSPFIVVSLDGNNFYALNDIESNLKHRNISFLSYNYGFDELRKNRIETTDFARFKYLMSNKIDYPLKKVFISYAHKDRKYFDLLVKQLIMLKREQLISVWTDVELIPGEPWHHKIQKELEEAEHVIFMISPSFFESEYIWQHEFKNTIFDNVHKILPLFVEPVILESENEMIEKLSALQSLNSPDNSIGTNSNQLKAVFEVTAKLREFLINSSASSAVPIPPEQLL